MTATVTTVAESDTAPAARTRRAARLATAVAGGWVLFLLLNLVFSGRWWLWLLPDLLPPIAFAVVPLVITAVVTIARLGRVPLAVSLLGLVLGSAQGGFNLAALGPAPHRVAGHEVRVVSWNTEVWDQWDDPGRFYDLLRAQDADVYLLQEYQPYDDPATQARDQARLARTFPGYTIVERGELLTLSRLPVVRSAALPAEPPPDTPWISVYATVKSLRTDVVVGGRTLSFYNVHTPVQLDLGNPLTPGFYSTVRDRDRARHVQYQALEGDLRRNTGPVVVAGDFNTSPVMGDIRPLTRILHDAASADRSFYPASWRTYWPVSLWRLDWAFTSAAVHVDSYRLADSNGMSDHAVQQLRLTLRGTT